MGWNPWNAFRTEYDEAKMLAVADTMVRDGLVRSGYRYMNIDDGWWLKRDASGTLQIRTTMFPSARISATKTSFRPFVDQLHARGMKAGIYTDIGLNACSQHWDPASTHLPVGSMVEREVGLYNHQLEDARLLFGEWTFDYVKVDACGLADYGPDQANVESGEFAAFGPWIHRKAPETSEVAKVSELYASFAKVLQTAAEHPPVFEICAWGEADVNDWAHRYANLWRTSSDIEDTWPSMLANFDGAAPRALFAGPGHWNDPDMLEVGNGAFDQNHITEAQAHMSLWAILAAPLILSYDLTVPSPKLLEVVTNPEMIAIDQDRAGNQGVILSKTDSAEIVYRSLSRPGSRAVALVNRGTTPVSLSLGLADLHLRSGAVTRVHDIWRGGDYKVRKGLLRVQLASHETALLRVDGEPAHRRTVFLADIPAMIDVEATGTRSTSPRAGRSWIPAQVGYLPSGEPIVINGRREPDTLGVAPASRLRITLPRPFRRFLCQTGVGGAEHSAKIPPFAIYGDGKLLISQGGSTPRSLDLPIRGVHSLELVAPSGDFTTDWAFLWSHARLLESVSAH